MNRRSFVAAASAALLPLRAQGPDYHLEVLTAESVGRIAPEVYGHFVEHLGGVVYDGIWVGEKSKVANTGGLRTKLIDAFRRVKPAVVRWPGGCFADSYNWRDGIGPRAQRPRRPNFWDANGTAGKYEPNEFGTQEFLRFCELTGSQAYVAANLRSLTARDFYEWVDYLNAPAGATTLAEQREAHGHKEPYNVRYWGVGNESWGCGGNFNPEEYAVEYRRFVEWVPKFGKELSFVGSGPSSDDPAWTRRFFGKLAERGGFGRMWGWGLHHYSWNVSAGKTNDWDAGKGQALNYPLLEYYELLKEGGKMDHLLNRHWDAMAETDRTHRVKIVVDEWGSWFRPGSEVDKGHHLGQQATMRDALLASLTFDIFHKHAEKVAMANIAQLVNCLQALFFAHEDQFALTPTYHVFDLYQQHQGGEALRTVLGGPALSYDRNGKPADIPGISASASRKGNTLHLTVSNFDPKAPKTVEVALRGAKVASVTGRVLASGGDLNAHNSFADPNRLTLATAAAPRTTGNQLVLTVPAASVQAFTITLG